MSKLLKNVMLGAASILLAGSMSTAMAEKVAEAKLDVSRDGIFTALTSSRDLQATVDHLIAAGADHRDVVAIAGAAGIAQDKVEALQVCVNSVSADARVLGATCMRPQTLLTAYNAGTNDPLNYLPATAAGHKAHQEKSKK
jgi:hypothetical protein